MQRLLQGSRHDRTPSQSDSQISTSEDDLESLLGLYTRMSSTQRRSESTTVDLSVSDALTVGQDDGSEHTITVGYERPGMNRERTLGSRRPTLESAQRWLHKEVRPQGPYDLAAQQGDSARAAGDLSRGALSDDEREGRSLPSVVSSTEMFTIGGPRKGLQ